MHGGLSPDLQSMEQVKKKKTQQNRRKKIRFFFLKKNILFLVQVRRIARPTDIPDQGLLCDLLWYIYKKRFTFQFVFQLFQYCFV